MNKFKEIRPISLGIIIKDNKLLVSKGYDKVKKETFYRCLGGGIEFQEESKEALKRELLEEINVNIKVNELLSVEENIFVFDGKKGHEIIFLYNCEMNDKDYKDEYYILDSKDKTKVLWIDINKFINKELIIYPKVVIDYLK